METKNKKRERILMLVLLATVLVALAIYLLIGLGKADSWWVIVELDGEVYATLPLDVNATLRITCDGGYNLLVIKDGEAYIESADCPGGDCVRFGTISPNSPLNLRVISCLPHAVTVYLKGGPS